jgi:hypothetical protein
VVQGQIELHWFVPRLQHCPATQSAFEWQQAAHAPVTRLQHWLVPPPQSASAQQRVAATQAPPQQRLPAPHCASLVQAQVPHRWVVRSQHCPARQSALAWQQATHLPPSQHWPLAQSPSPQHCAVTHWSSQQRRPVPHCASVVQGQLVEHFRVLTSQHWLARQSPVDRQQVKHAPLGPQHCPGPQSASTQHWAATHLFPQHFCPAPHCALEVQAQFWVPHWRVSTEQHWLARQSAFDRQQATQAPFWQHWPAPHSSSPQQEAATQAPFRQQRPAPHSAFD